MGQVVAIAVSLGLGVVASEPASPGHLKPIPWVECNWPQAPANKADPRSRTTLDHVVEGLLVWQRVTDTAIVSTIPGRAGLFTKLRDRVPGMRIIPGLKTMDSLDRFDSVDGWRMIAREISAIRRASGERVVLLENEKAVYPFIRGKQSIDMDRLKVALGNLPKDVEYLWYPSIFGTKAEQVRCSEVCRAVEAGVVNVRFLDQRFQGKHAVTDRRRIAADRLLKGIASRPALPMAYFYGPDHPHVWWRDDEILKAMSHIRRGPGGSAEIVLYPGLKHWVGAARSLSGRLPLPPSQAGEP